jgi:hypothetical protein
MFCLFCQPSKLHMRQHWQKRGWFFVYVPNVYRRKTYPCNLFSVRNYETSNTHNIVHGITRNTSGDNLLRLDAVIRKIEVTCGFNHWVLPILCSGILDNLGFVNATIGEVFCITHFPHSLLCHPNTICVLPNWNPLIYAIFVFGNHQEILFELREFWVCSTQSTCTLYYGGHANHETDWKLPRGIIIRKYP